MYVGGRGAVSRSDKLSPLHVIVALPPNERGQISKSTFCEAGSRPKGYFSAQSQFIVAPIPMGATAFWVTAPYQGTAEHKGCGRELPLRRCRKPDCSNRVQRTRAYKRPASKLRGVRRKPWHAPAFRGLGLALLVDLTMFGDVFGTRADYTRGLMYASRRQYLIGPGRKQPKKQVFQPGKQFRQQCREEILKPPEMFLTRKQARRTNGAKHPHSSKSKVKQLGFASK